jgi:hypothetical protein
LPCIQAHDATHDLQELLLARNGIGAAGVQSIVSCICAAKPDSGMSASSSSAAGAAVKSAVFCSRRLWLNKLDLSWNRVDDRF